MSGELLLNLLNPAITALFVAIILVLWSQRHQPYLLLLALALTSSGLGFAVQGLLLPPEIAAWRLVPNLFFFAALLLVCSSALLRSGAKVPLLGYGLVAAGGVAGLCVFFFLHPSLIGRVYVANIALGLILGLTLPRMIGRRRTDAGDWLLIGLGLIGLGLCVVRPVAASFEGLVTTPDNLRDSGYWLAIQFVNVLMTVLVAMAFLGAAALDMFAELRAEARRDPLSGLLNRAGFEAIARRLLAGTRSRERNVALLIADLDDFKTINDTFGHGAGDRVIAAVGRVLREQRAARCAGRIGGEEFALLFTDMGASELKILADGLVAAITRLRVAELPADYRITISAGLHVRRGADNLENLLAQADKALYAAKRAGKNRLATSPDLPAPGRVNAA